LAIKKKTFPGTSPDRPRVSNAPIKSGYRPEILFICRSGFAAETLITVLKSADYSITHAETKTGAIDWLSRRRFQAMIVDCSVPDGRELQVQGELRGVPVITITTQPNQHTSTGITAASVKELLAAVFKLVPLDWFRRRKKAAAAS
jgi:DNA-binding NtrC family response regulator